MKLKVAILAGDGIGPEVTSTKPSTSSKLSLSSAATTSPSSTTLLGGWWPSTATGSALPTETLDIALDSDAVLLGAVGDNKFNHPHPGQAARGRTAPDPPGPRRLRQPAAPRSPTPRSLKNCARRAEVTKDANIYSSSASSSAASTSALRAGGTKKPANPSTLHALHQGRKSSA